MLNRLRNIAPPRRWVMDPAGRCLIMIFLILFIVTGIGCSTWYSSHTPAGFKMRPASGDLARIKRNAHYYQLMGRPELALKELEEAHRRDPGNLKVADALAQCYEQVGRPDRARQIYREAMAWDEDNAAIENNLCYSYYLAGNFQQAEACFRKALARHPDNVQARNNLGLVLCRLGRPEEARRLWEQTEGAAVAAEKLSQVMASLGTATPGQGLETAPGSPPKTQPESAPPASLAAGAALSPGGMAETPAAPASPRPIPASPAQQLPEEESVNAAAAPTPPSPAAVPASSPPAGYFHRVEASPAPVPTDGEASHVIKNEEAPRTATASSQTAGSQPGQHQAQALVAARTPSRWKLPGGPLTCPELVETAIEVRNGNGTPDLARGTRSSLELEGFTVVAIANHLDFGKEKTVVYYRPGAERVARTLSHKFFRDARMETGKKLADDVDIRIVLGHDFTPQYADTGDPAKQKAL
jgi:Tfp pilus assembly protein PilF